MRSRLLIPVLAVAGTATLSWAREPAPAPAKPTASASAPIAQAAPQLAAPSAKPVTASASTPPGATPPASTAQPPAPAASAPSTAQAPTPVAPTGPASPTVRYRVPTAEAPRHVIAGGKGRATLLLNPSTGATAASVTLLELQPGAEVPEHTHDTSAEILYIEQGTAEMTVSGEKLRVGKADAVYIPAGAKHSARVLPGATFKAVQVYAGPGPEQRFTQGPRENAPHGR
ncbi:cupin domain-containing protein [Pyxidicoccus parkwayensis]|uniref:Cupin domain-containing protein n=1 Tax=Pyxidicoccus parkwayensis TaxID=2813578 RepID=A0ABX7NXF1_9BACT|nr:cupin domain-containing protein [Pyxidicoccus parkwaysis]QSQ22066.1 cupin domain-containing protein [Pyxidicoccus parkwaysis]